MVEPVLLATAVEIVLRAGAIQLEWRDSGFHVSKKGATDLVTEVDFECERMCRAIIADRFPTHDVLAEELGTATAGPSASRWRWVFDPLPPGAVHGGVGQRGLYERSQSPRLRR